MTRDVRRETFYSKAAEREERQGNKVSALLYRNEAYREQSERDEYDDVLKTALAQHEAARKMEEI